LIVAQRRVCWACSPLGRGGREEGVTAMQDRLRIGR